MLVGIVAGLIIVLAESTEGGAPLGLARLAFVGSVYVGLETAALLLGYLFLSMPLGLL